MEISMKPDRILIRLGSAGLVRQVDSWISGESERGSCAFCFVGLIMDVPRCGNGLLTHILVSEGYQGYGIDLRARTSWDHYPESTRAALHVYALDPTQYIKRTPRADNDITPYFPPGVFLVGNHADELTPWLPILATLENTAGYLSIPCCSWSFDERFSRSASAKFSDSDLGSAVDDGFVERLNLGGEGGHRSQYSMYRIWLARLSQWLGWKVECDVLRIPSTRNWAIISVFVASTSRTEAKVL
jgi:tRNASer (uridine44-2'-O)-methyltransferase